MAQIIGIKEKQLALKEINEKLRSLQPINEFLSIDLGSQNPSGIYTVSFGTGKDKNSTTLLCKDPAAVKALVENYKKELVSEIKAQAEKHSIEFEDSELALFE